MDSDDTIEMVASNVAVAVAVHQYYSSYIDKQPRNTSCLTGIDYVEELLAGHPGRIYDMFRMEKHVFERLCETLECLILLTDDGQEAERFQHSNDTIHRTFKRVLYALAALAPRLIRAKHQGATPPEILNNPKYYPYFQKCIGAIDGTHVAAWAPKEKQTSYCGRKSVVTQNVMCACSFDMMFTFVGAGWEGTANDARVFMKALTGEGNNFPFPDEGYYYVVDSGYTNMPRFLAPYRGERYHLQDYRGPHRAPKSPRELFNYRHSSLRNVIERCFGVLKARFAILKLISNYPVRRQQWIPIACCVLHNFIQKYSQRDNLFEEYEVEDMKFRKKVKRISLK